MTAAPALHISDISAKIAEVEAAYRGYCDEFGITEHQIIVNNSGGKDSGATELLARAIVGDDYRSVAADTGNEHTATIEHLKTLHLQRGGAPVEIVTADYPDELFYKRREKITKEWQRKQIVRAGAYRGIVMPSLTRADTAFADLWRQRAKALGWGEFATPLDAALSALHRSGNPFLDMALLHGSFPLGRQRFCTDELKMQVVFDKVLIPLLVVGKDVVQWSGVRADESEKRATYDRFSEDKRDSSGHLFNFMPIHQWTAADVFALYRYFGVKPNPLYSQGMGRVGCMPCILVAKSELAEIATRWPEEIERVAKWEQLVAMTSRWMHWMMVGHVDRRQFKPMAVTAKVTAFEVGSATAERRKKTGCHWDDKAQDGDIIDLITRSISQKLGVNARLQHRSFVLDVEAYRGNCMLGPRGNVIGGTIHDAVDWARTGRGGKTYDLVTSSLNVDVCSSRYGLCG